MLPGDAVADWLADGPAPGLPGLRRPHDSGFRTTGPIRWPRRPSPLPAAPPACRKDWPAERGGEDQPFHHDLRLGRADVGPGGHWTPGLPRGVEIPPTILNGMNVCTPPAMAGGVTYVSMDRIEMLGPTPTTVVGIVMSPEMADIDLSSLILAVTGGAAGSASLRSAGHDRIGSELCEGHAMTGSPSGAASSTPDRPPEPGGVGRAPSHIALHARDAAGQLLPPGETGE